MTATTKLPGPRVQPALSRVRGWGWWTVLLLTWVQGCGAAEKTRSFNVPAGDAALTLELFAEQAGNPLLFLVDQVRGVPTKPVRGVLAPSVALEVMLSGTGLSVKTDPRNGALGVRRTVPAPAPAAAAVVSAPRPRGIIQLDTYYVREFRAGLVNEGVIPRTETDALAFTVISRKDIEHSGAVDIAGLFQRIVPQASNWGTGAQAVAGENDQQGPGLPGPASESINLRGFGGAQTVILINGRRTYGGEDRTGDVNRIPLSAIERVEILSGSASALFGGNATGGVVNVILKKDFSGSEITERFSLSSRNDAKQNSLTVQTGWSGNEGRTNLTATFNHSWQEMLKGKDRRFYARSLEKISPDTDRRFFSTVGNAYTRYLLPYFAESPGTVASFIDNVPQPLGIPGSPTAVYAVVPAGSSGVGLSPESFQATAGVANLGENGRLGEGTLLPGYVKTSANAQLEHALRGDRLGFYAEAGVSRQKQAPTLTRNFTSVRLYEATDPANPFRNEVTPGFVGFPIIVYWNPVDLPSNTREGDTWTGRFVSGLKGQLEIGRREWTWALDGSWEASDTQGRTREYQGALGSLTTAGLYNPFRDVSVNPHPAEILARGGFTAYRVRTATQVAASNLRANGQLWSLPAGWAKLSVGAEVRWEDYFFRTRGYVVGLAASTSSGQQAAATRFGSDLSRRATAGYVETTIPVLSPKWTLGGAHGLEISAAARREKYDDFRGQNNDLVALKFSPTPGYAVRFSFSNSFNPPSQSLLHTPRVLFPVAAGGNFGADAARGNTPSQSITTVLTGGNPGLRPETSDSAELGLILTPRVLPGLTFSVDAFRIRKVDTPVAGSVALFLRFPEIYGDRLTRDPLTEADRAQGYTGGVVTSADITSINLATVDSQGADFTLRWEIPTASHGRFTVAALSTWTQRFRTQANPSLPRIDQVDLVGNLAGAQPLDFKGNASVYWEKGAWGLGLSARYLDSYATDSTVLTAANATIYQGELDGASINGSVEFDFEVRYAVPESKGGRWLAGTQWTLRVNNLLDQAPPQITDRFGGYSRFNDPRMRYFMLEMKKAL